MTPAVGREAARTVTDRIAADPVWFAETILGHNLWALQRQIMRAVAQRRARVAVKSCHASSKSFTAAELVLWAPYAGGIAITTAPTFRQVQRMVWAEVHSMYPKAKVPLGGQLLQTAEFKIAPDLYALGMSTDKGVNFQGFHARADGFMLIILDEAPGVEQSVMTAIEGVRAGGDVRVLMLGNPDLPSGPFYDAFGVGREGWQTFTIDGFETPNLEDEEQPGRQLTLEDLIALPEHRVGVAPRPYLITREFILEKHRDWGETSPLWQSKIRGNFPDQAADALISLAALEAARRRELEPAPTDAFEAGIDVAGPGEDETVLTVRHGPKILHQQGWVIPDPRGDVIRALEPWQLRLSKIKVDSVGMGYYFAKHLEDQGYRGKVVQVNVGDAPRDREKYANLKAELYWGLRKRADDGDLAGITDKALSQLASIKYSHNSRGQVVIESKDEARKRGVKSPDYAESVMLAFANVGGGKIWSL